MLLKVFDHALSSAGVVNATNSRVRALAVTSHYAGAHVDLRG